ncbi:4'-phosphopantetheinyl transferase family protein [Actinophytocola gossypii]|uniref:4'-phosphopantetheinyl transferase superfamily protein n=1 Tax=Actinophytocola gossypii TaxID=2812003 RepID=A0ABT2J277_9PSEU|nr:4'-phosphopantetheinyl transferase superfamily protein [Actinophytocola gossypii]MCT2581961.1 4'-phosphopantetheinyl transferase superfamily protein [Actinophytocola gossypii]
MISGILPAGVSSVETFDDLAPAPLFAAEEMSLAGASPKRRAEFATARRCARLALAELGIPPGPLPRGAGGAPVWPAGVVGSMTHCAGYRAAAVGRAGDLDALGIDAEPDLPLPTGVHGLVSVPAERDQYAELARTAPHVSWDRLLFCVKEAVYKAWFPTAGEWLAFRDATVEFAAGGAYTVRLRAGRPGPARFAGRWTAADGLLVAVIAA